MQFNSLRPMIWSADFEETLSFYTEILGFTIHERNDDWGWASLSKDNIDMMVAKPNAHVSFDRPVFTGSFYFNVSDVESLWESLKGRTRICYELETFEWEMREFAIYDNNGYLLQFGEAVERS